MPSRRLQWFLGVLTVASVSAGSSACGNDSAGPGSGTPGAAQNQAPLTHVDQFGRTWIRSDAPVVYDTNTDAKRYIQKGPEPKDVKDVRDMTLDEATEALRPKELRGDWEYTLAETESRELASEVQAAALSNAPAKVEGETALGVEDPPKYEGQPSAPTQIIGTDNRISIESLKGFYPYNNVAVMSNAGGCTTFKLINHHTAVTAAHCVHSGSGWLTRKQITFRPLSTVGSTCYGMTVPSCWDGNNRQCDYATIKFREGTGYCDFNTYNSERFTADARVSEAVHGWT